MRSGFDSPTTQRMEILLLFAHRPFRVYDDMKLRSSALIGSIPSWFRMWAVDLYTVRWSCVLMSNMIEMCGTLNDIRDSWECSSREVRDQLQNRAIVRVRSLHGHAAMPSMNNPLLVHILIHRSRCMPIFVCSSTCHAGSWCYRDWLATIPMWASNVSTSSFLLSWEKVSVNWIEAAQNVFRSA